ncbi:DUF11 domain-containing protein [Streptomyces sp. NPDC050085]|uniref:DUF11 domain-containing protein n=1 Tax=Streptomyces sp. NPDC050085 TaxID=3365600 RepID=UPI0037A3D5F5
MTTCTHPRHLARIGRTVAAAAVLAGAWAPATHTADLGVTLTGPAQLRPTGQGTWTVTVHNTGPSDSPGATMTLSLPEDVVLLTGPPAVCELSGGSAACTLGRIAEGASLTMRFTARAEDYARGRYVLAAAVTGTLTDPDASDDTATRTTFVGLRPGGC